MFDSPQKSSNGNYWLLLVIMLLCYYWPYSIYSKKQRILMDFIVIVPIQSGFCESAHQNSRQADRILGRVLTESSQGMVSGNPWKSSMEIPGDFHGISMF